MARSIRSGLVIGVILVGVSSAPALSAQTTTTKRDTTKAATKAGTTTTKPATTKTGTGTTTTKPATSGTAKPATGATTAKPASSGTARPASATAASTRAAASKAPNVGRPVPFDEGGMALYGGMAVASLSFSAGPSAGLAWRRPFIWPAVALRADIAGSHHSQAALVSGGEAASLTHVGGSLGLEATLRRGSGIRPYIGAAAGVYRFQASGPAGKAALVAGDVFASTTDVAGIVTAGLRLNSRLFVEGRYITVGDFTSMPISVGVRF